MHQETISWKIRIPPLSYILLFLLLAAPTQIHLCSVRRPQELEIFETAKKVIADGILDGRSRVREIRAHFSPSHTACRGGMIIIPADCRKSSKK
ncbi:MAG: hypothetical protein ACE5L7_04545 [Candidatus Aminicenantales bacterium]